MDRHRRTKPTGRAALDFAADPDWRRRAKLGLCPTIPLHDDATRTTACWLIAGRRDVSVARTDRKREEREMRTCRDVQSIKRERERETERGKRYPEPDGNEGDTGGETKGNRHDQLPPPDWQQQQQIFFLYWTIVFFSFSIQLSSLPFSDASVCSHQPWNRRRPKQFSPKDHPAVSLGSFFLVSPSPTGSMRIYKEHEPYVSTQVWWRAFGNHCSSAHPFSFFFFVFCVSWSITRSKRCAQG